MLMLREAGTLQESCNVLGLSCGGQVALSSAEAF